MTSRIVGALTLLTATMASASTSVLNLSRVEAEREALKHSNQLQSFVDNKNAAVEQTGAQYASLFPRLTFDAYYMYIKSIPQLQTLGTNYLFGAHNNWAYGPTLTYTVWDTRSTRNAYYSLTRLTESRNQDRRSTELQILLETRTDYVRVQELIEELRAANDSLNLSRAQYDDITKRLHGGGATRLDHVEAERAVLSYQIEFDQKQAELSTALRDLLSRIQNEPVGALSRPGPADMANVGVALDLDSIQETLEAELKPNIPPPDDSHPRVSSREELARASDLQSESIRATLWPTIKLSAKVTPEYPNTPIPEQVLQGQILLTASIPIFEMDQTRHLAQQKALEAEVARHQKEQTIIDLNRDFANAKELITSLRSQRTLATENLTKSLEAARLYYQSYRAGKSQLIDVQSANNRAFLARVSKSQIEAQILNQLNQLKALSGREVPMAATEPKKKKNVMKIVGILLILVLVALAVKYFFFSGKFLYAGTLEGTKVDLSSRLSSAIKDVNVREGDHVKTGQVLETLDCEDYIATSDLANTNYNRNLELYKAGTVTKETLDQLKNKKIQADIDVSWCTIKSPIDGTVLSRYREPGEWVNPGVKLLTLENIKDIWAYIYVPQPDVSKLKPGQKLKAILPEQNNREFTGTILKINDEAEFTPKNVQTRAERSRLVFGVKVSFLGSNDEEVLKPGMTIEIELPE